MKLFNKKENLEEARVMGPEIEEKNYLPKSTGAKIAIAGLALTGLLLGGSAIGLYHECKTNDPTTSVCPITIIETKLFGYKEGLKHQYNDLCAYDDKDPKVSEVKYNEPGMRKSVPEGYILEDGVGVSYIEPTTIEVKNPDGSVSIQNTLPSGYVLTKDEDGNAVGVKKVEPTTVYEPANISFAKEQDDVITYGYWSYDGEGFEYDEYNMTLTHKMGR